MQEYTAKSCDMTLCDYVLFFYIKNPFLEHLDEHVKFRWTILKNSKENRRNKQNISTSGEHNAGRIYFNHIL